MNTWYDTKWSVGEFLTKLLLTAIVLRIPVNLSMPSPPYVKPVWKMKSITSLANGDTFFPLASPEPSCFMPRPASRSSQRVHWIVKKAREAEKNGVVSSFLSHSHHCNHHRHRRHRHRYQLPCSNHHHDRHCLHCYYLERHPHFHQNRHRL